MRAVLTFFVFLLLPIGLVSAQELRNDHAETYRGKVLEIVSEEIQKIPGTNIKHLFQTVSAEVLSGPQKGRIITIGNDYLKLDKGDRFYFNYSVIDGRESYNIVSIDRKNSLIALLILFILAVVVFTGWQGVRSLIALVGSLFAIFYILLPGLLNGWNPLLLSFLIASGILFIAIFFTHGFNRKSAVAYIGTMIAVLITGVLAILSVYGSDLSGFVYEESVLLKFSMQGTLDFTALLISAIIIGVLGILDDIAITQTAVVTELFDSNKEMTRREVYKRALRVGREHVGALINTLVLAYTGASLSLLMYFYTSPTTFGSIANTELFATEIVRTLVGSIGLVLTMPIVTLLAVFYLKGYKSKHAHNYEQ